MKIKEKRKNAKSKIIFPFLLILILAVPAFLIYGGTAATPFDLPDPGSLLRDSVVPGKDKIVKDLSEYESEDGKLNFDTLCIEKRTTAEKKKKDTVYVLTETDAEDGVTSSYYQLVYEQKPVGGWKLKEVKPYNVAGQKTSVAGVDNKTVLSDQSIYNDGTSEWEYSNENVIEHYTDVKNGLDFVVVYMELQNSYVKMSGTKEVAYKYNDQTKKWKVIQISKLTALSIEPIMAK